MATEYEESGENEMMSDISSWKWVTSRVWFIDGCLFLPWCIRLVRINVQHLSLNWDLCFSLLDEQMIRDVFCRFRMSNERRKCHFSLLQADWVNIRCTAWDPRASAYAALGRENEGYCVLWDRAERIINRFGLAFRRVWKRVSSLREFLWRDALIDSQQLAILVRWLKVHFLSGALPFS